MPSFALNAIIIYMNIERVQDMLKEEVKKLIEKCRESKDGILFKNFTSNNPTWDQFIKHLDHEYHNPPQQISSKPEEEKMINGVCLRNNFYLSVRSPARGSYGNIFFPQSSDVLDFFDSLIGEPGHGVSSFINFVGKEQPITIHPDRRDTLYWQCIGSTTWNVYQNDNDLSQFKSFVLNPGDVIFVPKGVSHTVITGEPRAAIAFSYNPDNYDEIKSIQDQIKGEKNG